jgi:hypothetical protein
MEGSSGMKFENHVVAENSMKSSLGAKSIFLFLLSVLFLALLTLFESSLAGLSLTTERILSLLLLVVPAVIGIVFGVLSILRKESRPWIGMLGMLLNTLFALFQLLLVSFAG